MPFAHEKLDVYNLALDLPALADELVSTFLADGAILLTSLAVPRAAIVLNLAVSAGKFSKPDKRRYYPIARGSTTECAAILDVCLRLKLVLTELHSVGKAMLRAHRGDAGKACEGPGRITGAGAGGERAGAVLSKLLDPG